MGNYYTSTGGEVNKDLREKSKKLSNKEMILFKLNLSMPCMNCGKLNKFEREDNDEELFVCFCKTINCDSIMLVNKDNKGQWWLEYV